jgi:hypothetical protein
MKDVTLALIPAFSPRRRRKFSSPRVLLGALMSVYDTKEHQNLERRPAVLPLLEERAGVRSNVPPIFRSREPESGF